VPSFEQQLKIKNMPYLFYSSTTFKKSLIFKKAKGKKNSSFFKKSLPILFFIDLFLFILILFCNFSLIKINFLISKIEKEKLDLNIKYQETQEELAKLFKIENLDEKLKEFSLQKPEKTFSLSIPVLPTVSFKPSFAP